jgi:hypothetical protein
MSNVNLTLVRYDDARGEDKLRQFLLDEYGGVRVPRGVKPELVPEFLEANLKQDSPDLAYERAVPLVRFYDRPDAVKHILAALNGKEADQADLRRSCFAAQAGGEFGDEGQARQAAAYFDRTVVRHRAAPEVFELLLEAAVALSPSDSINKVVARIHEDFLLRQRTRTQDRASLTRYNKVAELRRVRMPKYVNAAAARKGLLAKPPAERRDELIAIYMGRSPSSLDFMIDWAGSLLRKEAMQADAGPVIAAFMKALEGIDPKKVAVDPAVDFALVRAGQAVIYLGSRLSLKQRKLFGTAKHRPLSFLWDDLEV